MDIRSRVFDYLAAASLVIAFGGLFIGRLMLYPVVLASGDFLTRVAAKSTAWDMGHRVMLAGMLALAPAALALRREFQHRSPYLVDLAATLVIFGAMLGVGQYALDFAMLALAQIQSPQATAQFASAFESHSFTQWAFYKLPDASQLGLILFAVALWREGSGWRAPATLVTAAAVAAIVGPLLIGSIAVRIALGLAFLGFSAIAWKIATRRRPVELDST